MAQPGFTPIQLYRSTTPGVAPSAANLLPGELGFNISDGDMALYARNNSGSVRRLMNNPAGLRYPDSDGAANAVLVTNGAGVLSFTNNPTLAALTVTGVITASGGVNGNLNGNATTATTAGNVTGTVAVANGGTGATTATQALINLGVQTSPTGSEIISTGTTAQRDASPAAGYFRFNITTNQFEGFNGTAWGAVGGGATGGGGNQVFIENDQVVTVSYTITAGKNAGTFGPITINNGVTVTVPNGSVWTIV